ncbi:hypothetical protein HF086_018284 [Spodoptera exigua]|uniref:Fibroin heavy chain-like n=1 Tax=Spodoptera exigua TaxID=7107 RepID=A0A922S8S2_SPOEX|nr:hypothetical protein HF086_018284 [Spodoptera exigua]
MKPLFPIVVAILVIAANAHPENIEEVKELPQSHEPVVEAEASEPQARKERCTACTGTHSLKSPKELLASLKTLPNAEVHTQSSFEECSSEKGCAGVKIKDGKIIEKFGNLQAFKAAANADSANEFQFQAAGNSVFEGGVANGGPFWWMNQQDSPFKNAGGSFEKFSKSSSSFTSSSNAGAGGVDLGANPFLNGGFSKLAGGAGFTGAGGNFAGSQSFESSSSTKEIDISKNPFLSGGATGFGGQSSFGSAQGSFGAGQSGAGQSGYNAFSSGSKFGSGYTGSSPSPFAASSGANVNLIQNSQKNEFDFAQQTQQNIDEIFQSTGNVNAHDNSGGDLQQTCAGQGYVCVSKSQCNNGVVNTNGGGLLQANTQKQYCNTRTEICCRIETSGAGVQGSLGVGSGSFQASQGSGLFQGSSQGSQSSFGAGFNANRGSGFGTQFASGTGYNSNKFGATGSGFGSGFKSTSQSNFVETDSFSAGSENSGIYRPGAVGSGLKPGVPYLPPLDTSTSGSNVVSTAYSPAVVTTPRPFTTPRPVTTPRPYSTPKPYVPSTKAPEYLPPIDGITGSDSFQQPSYIDGQLILDENLPRPITPVVIGDLPAGCAAALKCTPIEYCTAEGVISNTTVVLTRDQEAYRVPLTDCKDISTGRVGKCCRDPFYTDPWPVNQIGQWVPGVFGGNDGKYVPDNRGSSNNQPGVTVRPPVTGSVYLNNFRTTPKPTLPVGPNQVTQGFSATTVTPGSFVQKTQYGQGSYSQGGQGQVVIQGQGKYGVAGQGSQGTGGQFAQGSSFTQTTSGFGQGQTGGSGQAVIQGQGFGISQGGGQVIRQGQGIGVTQGFGTGIRQGSGSAVVQGGGYGVSQGQGQTVSQGQGQGVIQGGGQVVSQGQGFAVSQGQGQGISQGVGVGVIQGQGVGVSRGQGFAVTGGQGQYSTQGQGSLVSRGQGQTVSQGVGFGVTQGQGTAIRQGQGFGVSQGQGFGIAQGGGVGVSQGGGVGVSQGNGYRVSQGGGFGVSQGIGFGVQQGSGQAVFQGQGQKLVQGGGFSVSNGGYGVENEVAESVQRVYLPRYTGSGECGILNPESGECAHQGWRMEAWNRRGTSPIPDCPGQNHPSSPALQIWKLCQRCGHSSSVRKFEAGQKHLAYLPSFIQGHPRRVLQWSW